MLTPTLLNNRYRVLRVLGNGGFGETFLAEDTQMPSGRRCVIKQLKPIANNPQVYQLVQERFRREAAILEELGNSCYQIPTLYAYFVEDGEFYLVQEYIEGQTLTQILQQGLLSESSVKEILINILPVLDYVHSKGIVHRDIKPDNILIRNSDRKPVLIDFGAVKETMGTTITASGNSVQSIVIGTPGFMPMEQSVGRPVFASDIYSLGLTAIYLLTGKIPQEFTTNPVTGEVVWRNFALGITPTFARILEKSIQPIANDRYLNAREILSELQVQQIHKTTVVSPGSNHQYIPITENEVLQQRSLNTWKQAILIGGSIGVFIVLGFWVIQLLPHNTVGTNSNFPNPRSTLLPIQASSGWIRLGSVNNTEGTLTIGEKLIKTVQAVTIEPPIVPTINSEVIIINGVNLRENKPPKPDYKLTESIGTLAVGQKVIIRQLYYFVDPNSPSPYTAVWAEVTLH
jgi:serine/threonine protein kinase